MVPIRDYSCLTNTKKKTPTNYSTPKLPSLPYLHPPLYILQQTSGYLYMDLNLLLDHMYLQLYLLQHQCLYMHSFFLKATQKTSYSSALSKCIYVACTAFVGHIIINAYSWIDSLFAQAKPDSMNRSSNANVCNSQKQKQFKQI